jgi:hypothetical protein
MTPAKDWPIPPMDHESGYKPSAFSWAMGRLILQRMGDRETIKAITADPAMPAYCTVYQWVKRVPAFADAYRLVRGRLAEVKQQEAAARRAALKRGRDAARVAAGKRVRTWVSGRKSSYSEDAAFAVCWEIEEGAPLSAVVAMPDMPSSKVVYTWIRQRPAFRAMYVEACRRRMMGLELQIDHTIDAAVGGDLARANAEIAYLEGRIGRLTPKIYRPAQVRMRR